MAENYAYAYAIINLTTGKCFQVDDTTDYIVDDQYVPISEYNGNYLFKYYYPIPSGVTSFDDFTGQWYYDEAHTRVFNI
nr:MAG TPA: hypothetical protein [Caudoviricetes sp.]